MSKLNNLFACIIATSCMLSCTSNPEYTKKYGQKEIIISCEDFDQELIKEVTYRFENFVLENYDFRNTSMQEASMINFLLNSSYGYLPYADRFDDEMIAFITYLKNIDGLWQQKGAETYLNNQHPLANCLIEKLSEGTFKNSFTALMQSNTIRHSSMATAIQNDYETLAKEKALRAYMAFDLFFAQVVHLDYTMSKEALVQYLTEYNKSQASHQH